MRFDTWNVRTMYRVGSLRVVAEEISKHKLDLVRLQEDNRDRRGEMNKQANIYFSMKQGIKIMN
jgi:hypothetical protein